MFTGLIEEVGTIAAVDSAPGGSRIRVAARKVLEGVQPGDSIAIDGACMTVVDFDESSFSFEASPESMARTNFLRFAPGTRVNLERPLTPESRIGGHYVTGHVDGQATIVSRVEDGNSRIYTFLAADPALAELLVPKGSVAILGISLTANTVEGNRFSVAIIPHTLAHTNLGDYDIGDGVNIETDLLGKYVRRLLLERNPVGIAANAPTLIPAMQALGMVPGGLTPGSGSATIHTGGWFNHEPDPDTPN